jgi:putative Mn2+ efflux pump MntP
MAEHLLTVILVAVVLGIDAFSLAVAIGLSGVSSSYEYKFSAVVGVFHVLMPLVGLYLGYQAGQILGIWAAWLGALIMAYVGISFIREGYRELHIEKIEFNKARHEVFKEKSDSDYNNKPILLLAASVSMDALATGFSLGTYQVPILVTVAIMGFISSSMTLGGFKGGKLLGNLVGNYAQIAGGVTLIMLAIKMLF